MTRNQKLYIMVSWVLLILAGGWSFISYTGGYMSTTGLIHRRDVIESTLLSTLSVVAAMLVFCILRGSSGYSIRHWFPPLVIAVLPSLLLVCQWATQH